MNPPKREEACNVEPAAKRCYRSKQERRQIAEESLQPGASVAVVARRHGVNANQVFFWRKLLREGMLDEERALTQLVPVRVSDDNEERATARTVSGTIHVELGRVRIRVEGPVDPESLRLVLEHLAR